MSQIKTLNGVQYTLPQYNDTAWGANTGNVLTQYLAAIADVTLQLSGGAFTLTADVDFGANFGLKALFLKSETANPASAGVVRLAKTDAIKWRNNANGADIALAIDGSDNLLYATNKVYTAGGAAGIVNADIASGAAIAYSKLALTGSILNADINASAAIAYSKLSLTGGIVNADVNASAAIAYSKLTLTGSVVNADINASAAIAYSKLALTGSVVNADVNASAAIALTKLAALAGHSKALASDGSGFIVESSVTATELGYVSGVTSAIQTQINGISSHYFQYIQATSTASTSTTSGTFGDTGLTASITPSSTSHKVKVTVTGQFTIPNGADTSAVTIKRGSTNIGTAGGFQTFQVNSGTNNSRFPVSISYVDSPAANTATTYTVQISTNNGHTATWNESTIQATMILEEIV